MSPPKSCAVCGDKALGCNFNAVTCESCKAFFRRNALAKKQFTCPFNQHCEINVVTRRFCQRCRLKKCLEIGMKSENIMSEEDKLIKRRKIEKNRAQRRLNGDGESTIKEEKQQEKAAADSSGYAFATSNDSQSCNSFDSVTGFGQPSSSTALLGEQDVKPELMTGEEMVEFIVSDADRASQAISKLMRTPAEAVATMEKIINSQKDALRLISHLIAYPGDALKIISKIMNSPFNALTVFTKFMSSPTDALEIISKIVSSPQDVLQFIKNLMNSPEDALDIMNKFMNTPAEALKIINKIFSSTNASAPLSLSSASECVENANANIKIQTESVVEEQSLIQSMLNSSPCGSQIGVWPQESSTSFNTTSPQTISDSTSPVSVSAAPAASDVQSSSPYAIETPSTSSIAVSLLNRTENIESCSAYADVYKSNNFDSDKNYGEPEKETTGSSINSLDSVLTEIIRLEFQGYNNLGTVPQELLNNPKQQSLQCGHATPMKDQRQEEIFSSVSEPICAPSTQILGRDLNEAEQMKLRELKLASEALYYPVDDDLSVLMSDDRIKTGDTHQDPKLLQVINLTAVAIKRLIKMAKKITAFRDLCQEDQVALLKGGCTEMMIMRSVMTYDDSQCLWKIPHVKEDMTNIRADVLKLAKGNVYEEHLKFIQTFDEKWRTDENIILIMCAIVLFTPRRPRVVHADVINLEQNSYFYLLRRYLESVYPGCEAKSAFMKLIQKISDVERLNRFCIGVYLNVNPAQVEPLLREIFDLKNH